MLIPFRSKAAGEFYMMDNHVQLLLALMGKTFTSQGIIQADEVSLRLTQLQTALAQSIENVQQDDAHAESIAQTVGLKQRAWPLIDMLTRAEKKKVDVVWGSSI
jgi:ACT domain-containing protein